MAQVKCTPERVLSVATAEVGYLEKKSNSQLDDKTANAGSKNYTKYARDLDAIPDFYNGKKNGYAWCDVFVDWCMVQAFGVEAAKKLLCQPDRSYGAGCTSSSNYYKQKGQFHTKDPKPGDQIFFKGSDGTPSHTGIVYKVDNLYVYTIEGNTSSQAGVVANGGGVFKKSYALSYNRIYGYGRPNYDVEEVKPESTKKNVTQLAQEVLAGKWGNGTTRQKSLTASGYDYKAVQAEVNRILKKQKTSLEIAKEVLAGKWGNGSTRKLKLLLAGYDPAVVQDIVNTLI